MKTLITLVLFLWASTGHAQQDVKMTKIPLNPVIYNALVEPLVKDLEKFLSMDLGPNRPDIYLAPREQIAEAYCEGNINCSVAAVTDRRTGEIYLTLGFTPNNLMMASILFHEIVHWAQVKNGWWQDDPDCVRWAKQEMQGYRLQSLWLVKNGGQAFEIPNLMDQCR